jgi:hypothetical protein
MRSLGIFVLGLLLGGVLGYAFHRPGRLGTTVGAAEQPSQQSGSLAAASEATREQQKAKDENILLGDIAAVPFQELYDALARQRPEDIAQLAEQLDRLPPNQKSEAKITAFFKAWAHLDPSTAFESATKLHSPQSRATAVGATIAGADPSALGTLAAAIGELPDGAVRAEVKGGLFAQAIGSWSQVDPPAAARLLGESKMTGLQMSSAFYAVAQNWAADDPEAALAWARGQQQSPFGLNPVSGAVVGWWKKDPAAAESYALSQVDTRVGKQLVGNLASEMANQDSARAAAWVQKIPDAEVRSQAYASVAVQQAFTDPKAAAEWASNLPAEAAPAAVGSVASIWAQSDPTAAAHWMEGLTGDMRDSAVSSYSYAITDTDPAAAAAWAVSIGDARKRAPVMRRAATQWLAKDPTAAWAWIQASSLGEEEKTSLLGAASPTP